MLLAVAVARGACAGQPPPAAAQQQVPLNLLEFLGSSDPAGPADRSQGGRWMRFLSQLNLGPAKPSAPAKTPPPGGSAPTPHPGNG